MLSKEECLKILELPASANKYEVENRYTMLIKRYRGRTDSETREIMENITLAYNILTGRYVEPKPEDPRLQQIVLGRSRKQWRNMWAYGKFPLLIILIVAAVASYFIYEVATNEKPDFQVGFIGQFGRAGEVEDYFDAYAKQVFPDYDNIEFFSLPMDLSSMIDAEPGEETNANDPNLYNYIMKMLTILVGDSYEIFVMDKSAFEYYAPQEAFYSLNDFYQTLEAELPQDIFDKIKPLRRDIRQSDDTEFDGDEQRITLSTEDQANNDPTLDIYGLDITDLGLTEGIGLYSVDGAIVTIGIRTSSLEDSMTFIRTWIEDSDLMSDLQEQIEATMETSPAS